MTGIDTASWISRILSGSAMRATPPSRRMSAGTRSSAITATAPASSAIRACSAVVTSMITPPLSISARPLLTRIVPVSAIAEILATPADRERLPRERVADFAADVDERLDDERQMRATLRALEKLSRADQDVLALCIWEELTYEQAALALGTPVGTVRSRLSRARARLRELTE